MSIAESILAVAYGANEARNAAMSHGCASTFVNGVEVMSFWQDNSALLIFGGVAVIAGKGQ